MKIGIIGTGNMGRTLGMLWAEIGHEVFFGARRKASLEFVKELGPMNADYGGLREAVDFGEVLFYSVRDLPSTLCEPVHFEDKVLIDPNNGIIPEDFNYEPRTCSFTERFREDLPKAHVIKAFNSLAQELYYHPIEVIRSRKIISPFCTDSEKARNLTVGLIKDMGLEPLDCGTIDQSAKLLESYADLVRLLMIHKGFGPTLNFSMNVLPEIQQSRFGTRQPTQYK